MIKEPFIVQDTECFKLVNDNYACHAQGLSIDSMSLSDSLQREITFSQLKSVNNEY
jgi:hypothetical protein